jgi:hypothetical protein
VLSVIVSDSLNLFVKNILSAMTHWSFACWQVSVTALKKKSEKNKIIAAAIMPANHNLSGKMVNLSWVLLRLLSFMLIIYGAKMLVL